MPILTKKLKLQIKNSDYEHLIYGDLRMPLES